MPGQLDYVLKLLFPISGHGCDTRVESMPEREACVVNEILLSEHRAYPGEYRDGTPHGLLVDPDALAAVVASEDPNGFARPGVQVYVRALVAGRASSRPALPLKQSQIRDVTHLPKLRTERLCTG
jgi:hypothetical protein